MVELTYHFMVFDYVLHKKESTGEDFVGTAGTGRFGTS